MKKTIWIPVLIILFALISYFGLNYFVLSSYDGDTFSKNDRVSKDEGMFYFYYEPSLDSFLLKDRKVKTPRAWSEKAWKTTREFPFSERKEIVGNEMNFIIEDTTVCKNGGYIYFIVESGKSLNCITSSGFGSRIWSFTKQIKVVIKQPSKELGWKQEIVSDTIIYNAIK